MIFPTSIEFTKHAGKRCKERNIDITRLKRQLMTIPYNESNQKFRWTIPSTNLFVVFDDRLNKRFLVTISFHQIKSNDRSS